MSKYATFNGRASRAEYWYFFLFVMVCSWIAMVIDFAAGSYIIENHELQYSLGFFEVLCAVFFIFPSTSCAIRRLHDTGKSGWWYFLLPFTIVGIFPLIVFLSTAGSYGDNEYGPSPYS